MAHVTARSQSLRQSIEAEMADKFAGALTPRPFVQRPQLPFGIASLDAVTGGGIPIGAVTEFVGMGSSGKTSAAMQIAAGAMRSGRMCAWVDASDSFDPDSGAANGMLLSQLLWVRCGGEGAEQPRTPGAGVSAGGLLLAEAAIDRSVPVQPGRCSSHPQAEEQGLDRAVRGLFQGGAAMNEASGDEVPAGAARPVTLAHPPAFPGRPRQKAGTPGAPNLPLVPAAPVRWRLLGAGSPWVLAVSPCAVSSGGSRGTGGERSAGRPKGACQPGRQRCWQPSRQSAWCCAA